MATVVAREEAAGPVEDERDVAVRQLQTRPHERQERKFDHPRRFSSTMALPPEERAAANACAVTDAGRFLATHVEHLDIGQRPAVDALGEHRRRDAVDRLGPRRRAAEEQDGAARSARSAATSRAS